MEVELGWPLVEKEGLETDGLLGARGQGGVEAYREVEGAEIIPHQVKDVRNHG